MSAKGYSLDNSTCELLHELENKLFCYLAGGAHLRCHCKERIKEPSSWMSPNVTMHTSGTAAKTFEPFAHAFSRRRVLTTRLCAKPKISPPI